MKTYAKWMTAAMSVLLITACCLFMAAAMARPFTTTSDWQMTGVDAVTAELIVIPAGTKYVEVQAQDANLRWTSDGGKPTATTGNIILDTQTRGICDSVDQIWIISTAGNAVANLHGSTTIK